MKIEDLKEQWQIFIDAYLNNPDTMYNATKSYRAAYPDVTDNTAAVNGHKLLRNTKEIRDIIRSELVKRRDDNITDIYETIEETRKVAFSDLYDEKNPVPPTVKARALELHSKLLGAIIDKKEIIADISLDENTLKELSEIRKKVIDRANGNGNTDE